MRKQFPPQAFRSHFFLPAVPLLSPESSPNSRFAQPSHRHARLAKKRVCMGITHKVHSNNQCIARNESTVSKSVCFPFPTPIQERTRTQDITLSKNQNQKKLVTQNARMEKTLLTPRRLISPLRLRCPSCRRALLSPMIYQTPSVMIMMIIVVSTRIPNRLARLSR